jgi:hypothetical protein
MKKVVLIASAVAIAAIASADLSISFVNNTAGVILDSSGATYLPEPSIVQLIWAPADNAVSRLVDGEVGVGGTLKAGEYLLLQATTAAPNPFGYGSWGPFGGVYSSADVGGADINTGYFFARVFNGDALANSYYYETTALAGASWMFDPNDPNNQKTYSDSIVAADVAADGTGGGAALQLDFNGTQVVPEPATIGLMGIAGLGMYLARRKVRT